jgi:hypothetical protein
MSRTAKTLLSEEMGAIAKQAAQNGAEISPPMSTLVHEGRVRCHAPSRQQSTGKLNDNRPDCVQRRNGLRMPTKDVEGSS